MALQVREKERECIWAVPSLVAHAVGYGMATITHHTVYAAIATLLLMLCYIWQTA